MRNLSLALLAALGLSTGSGCLTACESACRHLINNCDQRQSDVEVSTCVDYCQDRRTYYRLQEQESFFVDHLDCLSSSRCAELEAEPDRCLDFEFTP